MVADTTTGSSPTRPRTRLRGTSPRAAVAWAVVGIVLAGLALLVFALPEPAAAQCAMCRTALETPEAQAWAAAFRKGILFLLVVPAVTVAVIGTAAFRSFRP